MSVFKEPVVWGSIIALIGVLFGQLVLWRSKNREHALSAIQATVGVLRADYQRLLEEVSYLRKRVDDGDVELRIYKEKYSAALTHSSTLRIAGIAHAKRMDAEGVTHADLPPIPGIIKEDMRHEWPEAFEDDQMWVDK